MKDEIIQAIDKLAKEIPDTMYSPQGIDWLAKAVNNLTEALSTICCLEKNGEL